MLCLVAQSCLTLCNPMDCSPPGSSVCGDSPGKNTGLGCHALLRGILPTQGSNPGLLQCRWILYQLSYPGSPPSSVSQFLLPNSVPLSTPGPGASLRGSVSPEPKPPPQLLLTLGECWPPGFTGMGWGS